MERIRHQGRRTLPRWDTADPEKDREKGHKESRDVCGDRVPGPARRDKEEQPQAPLGFLVAVESRNFVHRGAKNEKKHCDPHGDEALDAALLLAGGSPGVPPSTSLLGDPSPRLPDVIIIVISTVVIELDSRLVPIQGGIR